MPKREAALKKHLINMFGDKSHSKPNKLDFNNSKFHIDIENTYNKLGGILEDYPIRFGGFDIQCSTFIVELDEERHFNRYRYKTLNSDLYNELGFFDISKYKDLCKSKEKECLKIAGWRKNWNSNSTENQFGVSDSEGVLGESGSSRWKQRAFYDYLRDVSSILINVPVIRISIWENIESSTINTLIKNNQFEEITELILERKNLFS